MTKALMLVDEARVNQKDQLPNTGYTIEFVLQKLYENNPAFVRLLGNEKVVKVSSKV
jgi:Na+-translocating ferredoxin:NAD+ oxidoreductase RnfE subunit